MLPPSSRSHTAVEPALQAVADWLALTGTPLPTGLRTVHVEWPTLPVATSVAGRKPPLVDFGSVDPLLSVEFAIEAEERGRVEIAGDWTNGEAVRVSSAGPLRSIWFSLPIGRHAYQWVLDGSPVPDPRRSSELGLSADGPFSTVVITPPSRRLLVRNPWRRPARATLTATPAWLHVQSDAAEVPPGGYAELELQFDPLDAPRALDQVVRLQVLEAENRKKLVVSARVRAQITSPVPVFLPSGVRRIREGGAFLVEVTGTALGRGMLRMTLRDRRTLRVLATTEHQCGLPADGSVSVHFGPLPRPVTTGRTDLILDTGALLENRRRFLLSLPEASGDSP